MIAYKLYDDLAYNRGLFDILSFCSRTICQRTKWNNHEALTIMTNIRYKDLFVAVVVPLSLIVFLLLAINWFIDAFCRRILSDVRWRDHIRSGRFDTSRRKRYGGLVERSVPRQIRQRWHTSIWTQYTWIIKHSVVEISVAGGNNRLGRVGCNCFATWRASRSFGLAFVRSTCALYLDILICIFMGRRRFVK